MSIKVLAESLINRIAAGEVIVRPSSVVKELVENSLDAGAKHILVELANDCRDIHVRDDGSGIALADVPLALVRHATSKLLEFEDLWELQTRGFRGEALASIAAVSRITVLTRHRDETHGSRVSAEGDASPVVEAAGAPQGTDVRVRDLFFNTPARLKFMKSPASELQQCIAIVLRQGLIRPDVGFVVKGPKGKVFIDVPTDQPWNERVAALLGTGVPENLIPVSKTHNMMTLNGFVLDPAFNRKDRRMQYFFVNGRPITSRNLSAVLSTAYRGRIMTQRFPAAVLNVQMPHREVDVNVHPTKEEVRFHNETFVSGLVFRGVEEALNAGAKMPSVQLDSVNFMVARNDAASMEEAFPESPRVEPPPARQQPLPFDVNSFMRPSPDIGTMPGNFTNYTQRNEECHPDAAQPPQPCPVEDAPQSVSPATVTNSQALSDMSAFADPEHFPQVLGQVGLCYIVASAGSDLLLIDQHAAHERLLYQRLLEKDTMKTSDSQALLIPISIDVPASLAPFMDKVCTLMQQYGIEIDHFGGNTYIVHSVPANLLQMDVGAVLLDLVDDIEQKSGKNEIDDLRDHVVTRMACHAAIKAGQALTKDEMTSLLKELIDAKMSFNCPHGRPTMIRLTMDQLDKQFKRKL